MLQASSTCSKSLLELGMHLKMDTSGTGTTPIIDPSPFLSVITKFRAALVAQKRLENAVGRKSQAARSRSMPVKTVTVSACGHDEPPCWPMGASISGNASMDRALGQPTARNWQELPCSAVTQTVRPHLWFTRSEGSSPLSDPPNGLRRPQKGG
jgi:hypothetical protein